MIREGSTMGFEAKCHKKAKNQHTKKPSSVPKKHIE